MNHIEAHIKQIHELDPYMSLIFTQGSCYKFASFLANYFGGEVVMTWDREHALALIHGSVYDINGIADETWFYPSDKELKIMQSWSFAKNRFISLGKCNVCEEPILVEPLKPTQK
jgi:hypothetical protein